MGHRTEMESKKQFYIRLAINENMDWPAIQRFAQEECGLTGVQEYAMEEAEVDAILGTEAMSGGSPGEKTINKIEASAIKSFYDLYFEQISGLEICERFLESHDLSFERCELELEDWNAKWRESYRPIIIENKIGIYPSWETLPAEGPGQTHISLYPGQGFGTGEHETTYLCLQEFCHLDTVPKRVLDFGCGSGILGITALKKTNAPTVFMDIEQSALDNCAQNLELNHMNSGFEVTLYKHKIEGSFDLIFANILAPTLIEEREFLMSKLSSGGVLILSGLLNEQISEIQQAYLDDRSLQLISTRSKGDWSSLAFFRQ